MEYAYLDQLRKTGSELYRGTECPSYQRLQGTIGSLYIYPIKSLGGIDLKSALLTYEGLSTNDGHWQDRMAMLAVRQEGDAEGERYDYVRFSQREASKLSRVLCEYSNGVLTYTGDGMEDLHVEPGMLSPKDGAVVRVRMYQTGCVQEGVLEGGPVTDWVRTFCARSGAGSDMVSHIEVLLPHRAFARKPDSLHRCGTDSQTLYTDGGQLLVASVATLSWMNEHLSREHGGDFKKIDMRAFRPNIVIEGLPPNAEDMISFLSIDTHDVSDAMLHMGGLSVRCSVTTIDPDTAERGKEPMRWLAKHRPARPEDGKKPTFGVNAVADTTANGMSIHIHAMATAINMKR